jgi:DNA repair exonuclease SbcCD ATPase subunit
MKRGTSGGIDLLLLDEALDGLDGEGQRRVCQWLEGLGASSIFVVSHDESLAEDFDHFITVEKTRGASEIFAWKSSGAVGGAVPPHKRSPASVVKGVSA